MTSLEHPSNQNCRFRIDPEFLLRQLPALAEIRRKRRDWNEFGGKIARELQHKPTRRLRKPGEPSPSGPPDEEYWKLAKGLVYDVMASANPLNASIRKRFCDIQNPSTAALYSNLSLWLAGKLGISLTITQPMLAVMLYAVHEASGNWEILRDC